jgi:putative DNA primase/helicase
LENDEVLVQRIQKQTDMKHSRAVSTSRSFRSLMSVERLQQPCHLDGSPLGRLLVFDNGVLDLDQWLLDPRAQLLPHDSRRFVTNALPYEHDPTAECPRLLSFMETMWPTQLDQRREYQKMLGYLLLAENPLQKLFILLGAPRSGKGTTLRLIRSLVGNDSCCAPNLSSLANDFGLDAMLGKSVALVGEMNQQSKLPDVAIDRLKSISGGDVVPVNRKNKGELYLEMPVRFVINCNRLPGFLDPSGALASRIVLFTMWESYLGREDTNLDSALRAELPGIAQFALEGLRLLLVEDGAFIAPQSAKNAAAAQRAIQAPTMTFLEACVAPAGPEDWISSKELYGAYCAWAQEQGHHPVSSAKLHIELAMRWPAINDVAKTRRTADGGVRERWRSNFTFTEEGRSYVTSAKLPNEA